MGKSRPPRTPKPKPKRKLAQVRVNKNVGRIFENFVFRFLTDYLKERDINGVIYKIPESKFQGQIIDIFIDSYDFLFVAIECKSIDDSKLKNNKIYLKNLSRKSAEYTHQFKKQHVFLEASNRYGLVAFQFTNLNISVFVPHKWVYDEIENGTVYLTVDEIIQNGYLIDKENKGSLKLFIQNKCKSR